MRILVTGADGFLGRGLVARLPFALHQAKRIVVTDRAFAQPVPDGIEALVGDLGDPGFLDTLLEPGFDLVFHLASVPGGLAEREQALGHGANLLAPIALAQGVALRRPGARLVFASSIAVYGALGAATVTEQTLAAPQLTYGAHKLMTEILLSDMTRRGALSAISLRFPGIVARPATDSGHGSAFMSQLFHRIAAGEAYACPVPASSTCWWVSRQAAVDMLLHAAGLKDSAVTVVQPPVLFATTGDVAAAVARHVGKTALVEWGEDETLRRLFGAMPQVDAATALAAGFKADADLDALAKAAISGES
ncbi:NAD-dependent epimerase/dehydratase family protein [Agrobacterium vitis]|uniref:NAD-dependent epimerase/dehydratase family protein n=1 Tax=Agrobacterium vitis TaxID=373 RepID=UPI0015D7844E|nr:NAD-dependent epimerase/dehydratase family protein [Agrobacterium vitis]